MSDRVVAGARALVGTPFRLHGRGRDGVDCVGVVALALAAAGFEGVVPTGYALRGGKVEAVVAVLDAALVRSPPPAPPLKGRGEVWLMRVGPGQLHLAISTGGGFVHADAGLRRVVERPGVPPWPVLGVWRMREA